MILAGEAVFIPPFHLGRYFKSSLLGTLEINEFQLGEAQALYGVVAMACYALGGPLADRFAPRRLLALSLLLTAGGSLWMATVPSLLGLKLLYAFWGASTVLVFWAPLIRATREWGGEPAQGRAFGLLDGGRGLVAALAASLAASGVIAALGADALDDPVSQRTALQGLAVFYALCCVGAAAAVWFFVGNDRPEDTTDQDDANARRRAPLADTLWCLRQPTIWLQAVVVIAAYSAYKGFDFYGLYLEDAAGVSKTRSAELTSYLNYLRVVATFGAGLLADRIGSVATVVAGCFAVLIGSYAWLLTGGGGYAVIIGVLAAASAGSYALRGIYFALLQESRSPRRLTGAAVGVISFVGFTPDIFMPWVSGWLVASARDAGDVLLGYERFYGLLAGLAAVGLVAALLLRRRAAKQYD
ncbi:Inner membrane protein YqcE [Botrimarina colliarenosi]|uniref:Inner membrane protein YqcE n=1 Tax=Botrimarina colliarenosi TaxID=2528001 RepID=A0A5C6APJ6_9BACT|nr:MFS transporter [Botrimarina colliarenosi]TWU00104.1 Inner membrane protein YqcE [Botrimarina colliarenosi]